MSEIDERDRQRQKDLERIRNFRLMDDDFLTKCFEDNVDATKLMLDLILPVRLTVHRVTTQATIKNLQGRSIRLDILAEDETGGRANVEIQRDSRGAGAKRARYNGSILDANSILSGDFKTTEEGVSVMCKAMEDMRNEAELKRAKEDALRMLAGGKLTHEEIAEYAGLTLDQVKKLAHEKSA